jgi:hypothetical protein
MDLDRGPQDSLLRPGKRADEGMRQLGGDLEIVSDGAGTAILARLPAIENSSTAEVSPLPDASTAAA